MRSSDNSPLRDLSWRAANSLWPHLAAPAVVLVAVLAPHMAPKVFGHAVYMIGVIAVVLACGLSTGWVAVLASAAVFLGGLAMDRGLGLSNTEIVARAVVFVVLAVVTGFGSERFKALQRRADQTVAELRRSEAVVRSILETGPDAMVLIDVRGVVKSFSPSAEVLFGWSADEVVGRNISMLMPAPYQSEHDGYIQRYLETGTKKVIGQRRQVTGLRKDATRFPLILYVGEVCHDGERFFTGFVHDLTALRAADQRAQDLRAQLAHVWSINSLGQMAAVLAHELNQPLAAITNYVRGARTLAVAAESPDDELIEGLDKAGDQALRAGQIIRRMRNLVTRNEIERGRESLKDLISEIDFMANLAAREVGAEISYRFAHGDDSVEVDRIQIQQVTINLVRNAMDAVRGGEDKRVLISTEFQAPSWVVRVEDSGLGFDTGALEHLLQPLQSEKVNGMGLGLSISQAILESHGGALWVEQSLLGGAAFCFRLHPTTIDGGLTNHDADSLRHRR